MGLYADIQAYREPKTGIVGLIPNPPDHSTDNGLLFSATWMALSSPDEKPNILKWLSQLLASVWKVPGLLTRYPGDNGEEAQDDNIGIASVSSEAALYIYKYGHDNKWCFNVPNPGIWSWADWLGRFPGFPQFIKLAAGFNLNIFEQLWFSVAFLLNLFEPKGETSGKCLLFLQGLTINEFKHPIRLLRLILRLWRFVMMRRYPHGIEDVYVIYFGPEHPFTKYGPTNFG